MRLANGIVIEVEPTFGILKFSAMRRERRAVNEDGTMSEEITARTYDLKSQAQGGMIQVTLPAEVDAKDFPLNTEVELVNPVVRTVASATFRGADANWYIKADDLVARGKSAGSAPKPQQNAAEAPHAQKK